MPFIAFSIGPVQAFVSAARRTTDLHAGSYLLSWLAGVAMLSLRSRCSDQGEPEFVRPRIDAAGLDTLLAGNGSSAAAGSAVCAAAVAVWPNRFVARVPDMERGHALAEDVAADTRTAWKRLAASIWTADLGPVLKQSALSGWEPQVRQTWDRQVGGTFDIAWAWSDHTQQEAELALASRKYLQLRYRAPEPGFKCTVVGELQELSSSTSARLRRAFWAAVSGHLRDPDMSEESLCAPAFIKRRLRHLVPGNWTDVVAGLDLKAPVLPSETPSTRHIALRPWRERLRKLQQDHPKAFDAVSKRVRQATGDDQFDVLHCKPEDLLSLHPEQWPKAGVLATLGVPSSFYAVIRLDVDHLGNQNRRTVLQAVSNFAGQARQIVSIGLGHTVYAAGDDLLALAPAENALQIASQLHSKFEASMRAILDDPTNTLRRDDLPTVSAAITITHAHAPLMNALSACASLLDDTAKRKTGRDAIAVAVVKPGGVAASWAMPWALALPADAAPDASTMDLQWIVEQARMRPGRGLPRFSSGFLYRLRQLFQDIASTGLGGDALVVELMLAEYMASARDVQVPVELARESMQRLHRQCQPQIRIARPRPDAAGTMFEILASPDLPARADAALIARFLADLNEGLQ